MEDDLLNDNNGLIARHNNHIYFYGEINDENQFNFIMTFNELLEDESKYKTAYIHINSVGGDFSDSMAIYDFLKFQKIKTIGIVEGKCFSGAVPILLGCKEKQMTKHSVLMVHEVRTSGIGDNTSLTKFTSLEDDYLSCQKLMTQIKEILMKETKIDLDNFNILKHDIYLDAEECLKLGFINKILE